MRRVKTDNKKLDSKKSRPFLVLPLLENNYCENNNMPKNTAGLKLFTKTWPPKRNNNNTKEDNEDRPLTATLEKPAILDISLIGLIDMSIVRKEFLNISNICRIPLTLTTKIKKKKIPNRPLSLPPTEKHNNKIKKNKRAETSEDSWEDDENNSIKSARKIKLSKIKNSENLLVKIPPSSVKKSNVISDANNNNKSYKLPRKRIVKGSKLLEVKNELGKSTKLIPEPCKTCGRPDQPERFHSHPVTPLKPPTKKMENITQKIPVKSTVQRPVAIKYKSKQTEKNSRLPLMPSSQRKPSLPAQKIVHTPPTNISAHPTPIQKPKSPFVPRIKSAKRTVTCYICGREFGTASLHLHEPKCLEKWERENANLPSHLRRKPPIKPNNLLSKDEWNKFAWESSQSALIPCTNCGRTFYPDRLIVHQRSCKVVLDNLSKLPVEQTASTPKSLSSPSNQAMSSPPSVPCYICGRQFGTHSIKIHEKQCLKKWRAENDALPADMREPEPTRNGGNQKSHQRTPEPPQQRNNNVKDERPSSSSSSSSSARKAPMFPCYICGRLFTVNSIYIHEPQCLKKWKNENDKLPPHKRRPQPLKPDVKFTREGKIDYEATNEANWQSHLSQLVPCHFCSRTFNPDRVQIHEKSCKG